MIVCSGWRELDGSEGGGGCSEVTRRRKSSSSSFKTAGWSGATGGAFSEVGALVLSVGLVWDLLPVR